MFTAALFTTAKTWQQPKCPLTEEWIKKMWYIYTMEYYSAIKGNEITLFTATRMDIEIMIVSEVSPRQISYDIICMWNLIKMIQKNLFIRQTDSDFKIESMVTKGKYGWGNKFGV